jgi:hypothetical protein
MSLCNNCGVSVSNGQLSRHQNGMKCKLATILLINKQYEIDNKLYKSKYKATKDKLKKEKKKRKDIQKDRDLIKKLYDEMIDKSVNKPTNIVTNNTTNTTNNNNLIVEGFTYEMLKAKMTNISELPLHDQTETSHKIAELAANHVVKKDNNIVVCTNPQKHKLLCFTGQRWEEDVNNEKSVGYVFQCVEEHVKEIDGDVDTYVANLVGAYREQLLEEYDINTDGVFIDSMVMNREVEIRKNIESIEECAGNKDNPMRKGYLNRFVVLTRGSDKQRRFIKKDMKTYVD